MRIAMLLHKSVEHDSRVRRAARELAESGHTVTVLHLPPARGQLDGQLDGFAVRSVTPPAWVRRRLPSILYRLVFFATFVVALRRLRPDAIHAHDAAMLAPGWAGARVAGAVLVYDSHEYAVGVPYRERAWAALVSTLERLLVPRCTLVITVSEGIAERLQERYRLPRRPLVVRNLPDPRAYDADFQAVDLRVELGLPVEAELVLHLGAAALDRGCEALVGSVAAMPGVQLLFLGGDRIYAARLRRLAADLGAAERVHFREPVPVSQVLAYACQASVGVSLLEDTCENHRLALPNKVFEYLAAGTPVVASDLPELQRTLADRPEAVLVDPADEAAIAAALRTALDGPRPALPSPFLWPAEGARLIAAYAELAAGGDRRGAAVVLVRNGVSHDARILREARLLSAMGFETTVVGVATSAPGELGSERLDGFRVARIDPGGASRRALARLRGSTSRLPAAAAGTGVAVTQAAAPPLQPHSPRRRLRRLLTTADYYRRGIGMVRRLRPRLIHANDYNTAWIGAAGKLLTGSRLVYDAHELWADRNLRPEPRPWLLLCEALFVRVADEVITTSPGYSQVLARRYRIPPPRVVRNVPAWRAGPRPQRDPGAPPLAVYFGAVTRNRGLAPALRALALVPELQMRFVGPEAWGYAAELRQLAVELGVAGRLQILDPIPPEQAASVLADADLGLALIEPACLSYRMTLPNKLYEYVAAGLPVLSSGVPVLAGEVRRHGVGLIADPADPAALAAAIRAMLDSAAQARFREAAARLATETVWEREQLALAEVYRPAEPDSHGG
ncbi:MAG TPA: glycosyltransferase [Solirubrobacterales bacterium]|nr:glycosyltransferase [Solirubrobacterales bacterium]